MATFRRYILSPFSATKLSGQEICPYRWYLPRNSCSVVTQKTDIDISVAGSGKSSDQETANGAEKLPRILRVLDP